MRVIGSSNTLDFGLATFDFKVGFLNDCPGRVDVSVLEWCLSPYKLI